MFKARRSMVLIGILSILTAGIMLFAACAQPAPAPAPAPTPAPTTPKPAPSPTPAPAPATSPTPSPAPKPSPTPTPTPTPTPPPAGTPASGVKFEFTSVTKSAGPSAPVQIVAQTEPNAECSIEFFYSNGQKSNLVFPSPNNVQKADAAGKVKFDGAMYRQVVTGTATIQVTVKSGDKTAVFKTTMEVTAS